MAQNNPFLNRGPVKPSEETVRRRQATRRAAEDAGHSKTGILRAVRKKCLDCCCGSSKEVKLCPVTRCDLWPFRLGINPWYGAEAGK